MPHHEIGDLIYPEQVRVVFRQMPIALVVNVANATLTALVLASVTAGWLLLAWLGLLIIVTIARGVLWRCYWTSDHRDSARRWALWAVSGSAFSGLFWGGGGAVLFPCATFEQMFLVFVIGGTCIGAIGVSSTHLPTLFAFLLPASLPIAARFLIAGSAQYTVMAGMIVVFVAAVSLIGLDFHRSIVRNLRLGFELQARTRELNQVDARLHAEIAERQSTEAELRQAQKLEALGQLTGGIAHDFNNLLTAVIGNLELALGQANGRVTSLLEGALRAAERGAALTQRLLAFGRKQRLDARSVDVATLVGGIEDMLRRTLGPPIRLVITSDPGLAPALVDTNQLELVILNLAINSRDAMPGGGVLRIKLENRRHGPSAPRELGPGDYVVLSITDSGSGMDEATLSRAVEPFFTTKDIGAGSGLGLAMVHGYAVQSGGTISIASKIGEGTTVEVWLPRASVPSERQTPARSTATLLPATGHILLCDDDPDVRKVIAEYLGGIGYTVHAASGPRAAQRILASRAEIDLLIVDYAMPEMNGLELIRDARRVRPNLKALLITGYADALESTTTDSAPLLLKPFKPADLALRVADILSKKAA